MLYLVGIPAPRDPWSKDICLEGQRARFCVAFSNTMRSSYVRKASSKMVD